MKDRQVPESGHAKQHQASRKRPRGNTLSCKAGHVCASVLVLAFVQCSSASQSGGSEGANYGRSSPPGREVTRETLEIRHRVRWNLPQYGTDPRLPMVNRFVQRQDPMAEIRRLAVAMEGEDRHEVANYVGMVLQKLADMNQLFLGERARKETAFHSASLPSVSVLEFVERVASNVDCPNLCLVLSLVYMDRLAAPGSELHLFVTPLSAHRLFAASLIIAVKFVGVKPESIEGNRRLRRLLEEAAPHLGVGCCIDCVDDAGRVNLRSPWLYEKLHCVTGLTESELKHLEHHMLQALGKDASVSMAEVKQYLVDFSPKADDLVPYVDRPYLGPPPFPFQ